MWLCVHTEQATPTCDREPKPNVHTDSNILMWAIPRDQNWHGPKCAHRFKHIHVDLCADTQTHVRKQYQGTKIGMDPKVHTDIHIYVNIWPYNVIFIGYVCCTSSNTHAHHFDVWECLMTNAHSSKAFLVNQIFVQLWVSHMWTLKHL